jgi:hypothetical protein
MSNSIATGVAYADPEFTTCYASEEIGYAAAAQGTVTQLTSKSTSVTLNKSMGRITMHNEALAGNAAASFTMNNTAISSRDTIIINVSGGATTGAYTTYVTSMTAGSAILTLRNLTGTSYSEAVVLNFSIIHGAA